MDTSQRKAADIAYVCYLLVAASFAVGLLVDFVYGSPTSPEAFAWLQGVGMLVLLPLALASLAAGVVGLAYSWKLRSFWPKEWGLALLPSILLIFSVVFAIEEQRPGPYQLLPYVQAAFVTLAFIFSIRWLAIVRKR